MGGSRLGIALLRTVCSGKGSSEEQTTVGQLIRAYAFWVGPSDCGRRLSRASQGGSLRSELAAGLSPAAPAVTSSNGPVSRGLVGKAPLQDSLTPATPGTRSDFAAPELRQGLQPGSRRGARRKQDAADPTLRFPTRVTNASMDHSLCHPLIRSAAGRQINGMLRFEMRSRLRRLADSVTCTSPGHRPHGAARAGSGTARWGWLRPDTEPFRRSPPDGNAGHDIGRTAATTPTAPGPTPVGSPRPSRILTWMPGGSSCRSGLLTGDGWVIEDQYGNSRRSRFTHLGEGW